MTATITRIFWGMWVAELIGCLILIYIVLFSGRSSGPEGPVGAWLIFIPPVILAAAAGVVWYRDTDAIKLTGIVFMALPLAQLALGPMYAWYTDQRTTRSLQGDDSFRAPAQRLLAHAIKAQDLEQVKALIPGAGDLNQRYNDETLLRFAVYNDEGKGPGLEIVRALIAAGADPDRPASDSNWPLTGAIYRGPALTALLLESGANPNRLDSAGRPLWWDALSFDTEERFATIRLLLDHGADVALRDSEGGPVARAANGRNWQAVRLLMERGAAWKNEQLYGRTLPAMFYDDFQSREALRQEIPEVMRWIDRKFDEWEEDKQRRKQ